jgi:glycosyltransferase involved in cell wall biosynthesis
VSPKILFTIAIPTFNRRDPLRKTVQILLPQLREDVELLILDNASEPSAEVVLEDLLSQCNRQSMKIIRHSCNVGSSANVLRCVEYSAGPWVWILSDDDQPRMDAVNTILSHIEKYPQAVWINFQSDVCSLVHRTSGFPKMVYGLDALVEACDSFSNFLFISSGLYKRDILKGSMAKAYLFSDSYAPHLALLFIYLRSHSGICVLSPAALVSHGKPVEGDHWDWASISLKLTQIISIPPSKITRRRLGKWHAISLPNGVPLKTAILLALLGKREELQSLREDETFVFRAKSLCAGKVKVFALFRLATHEMIAICFPILRWLGAFTGFSAGHPGGVPAVDLTTRQLADRRS